MIFRTTALPSIKRAAAVTVSGWFTIATLA